MTLCGLLHSEIHGSRLVYSSPWRIVVHYVLLRLPVPRHPPCALFRLTFIPEPCGSFLSLFCKNHSFLRFAVLSAIVVFFTLLSLSESSLSSCSCCRLELQFPLQRIFRYAVALLRFSLFSFQGAVCVLPLLPELVGSSGLEPPTSRLSGVRSNHLSYEPILLPPHWILSHWVNWWR